MIRVEISSNADEKLKELEESRKGLPFHISEAVLWGALKIQTTSRDKYFLNASEDNRNHKTSSTRLHRRTGRLSRSIHTKGPILEAGAGGSISTAEAYVGTNVVYGAHWELGFHGNVSVRAHLRKITKAFGRNLKEPRLIVVKPFSRKVDNDARPFLQPAMEEESEPILRKINEALAVAFKGRK